MTSRILRWLTLGGLAAGALVASTSAPAIAESGDWCSQNGGVAPCIESLSRDGVPLAHNDPTWQVDLGTPGPGDVQWDLMKSGSYELDSGDAASRFAIRIKTGSAVPRLSTAFGSDGVVQRGLVDGVHRVTITANPTFVAEGCAHAPYPWPCSTTATDQAWRLAGTVVDQDQWTDPVQRVAFYGVDFWTNVEVNSFPPGVIHDDAAGIARMALEFAGPHFQIDATTLFRGHAELTLPNEFLRHPFFIPSPTTMTPSSLAVAGGGPISTTTVSKASAGAPVEIAVNDMTFSIRTLTVKTGVIIPTRPTRLRAQRLSSDQARVRFALATPRGSKITGYSARCVSAGGHVVGAKRKRDASPIKLGGLRAGVAYTCKVRALSKAGAGKWSAPVKVARRP